MMRRSILACVAVAFFLAAAASAGEWYEGGTLHKATARQWNAATYRNRLATSADFIAAAKAASDMKELRARAAGLERCISEGTDDPRLQDLRVSEVAAACIILLGYD